MGSCRSPELGGCAIHMWELNETDSLRHLEKSGSQRNGGEACECRGR